MKLSYIVWTVHPFLVFAPLVSMWEGPHRVTGNIVGNCLMETSVATFLCELEMCSHMKSGMEYGKRTGTRVVSAHQDRGSDATEAQGSENVMTPRKV